ncbi:hypothetical protein KAJ27_11230 [bacterium]|nr:hypothetical protein [bacterium]
MTNLIYRFAFLLAIITFTTCMMNEITLFTSFIRSMMVFIAVLFIFFIGGHLLRLGVQVMEVKTEEKSKETKVK